jgi:hypothetical protein
VSGEQEHELLLDMSTPQGSALDALVGPVQNIIFLAVHYFNAFAPIIQQAGQAAVLGRLSLCVCLWLCCRIPFT